MTSIAGMSAMLCLSVQRFKYGMERKEEKVEEVDPGHILNLSFRKQRCISSENLHEQVLISNTVKSVRGRIRRNFTTYNEYSFTI